MTGRGRRGAKIARVLATCAAIMIGSAAMSADPPPSPAGAEGSGTISLIDLTDEFEQVWTRDRALPDAERAARFQADFGQLLPGFYTPERFRAPADRYDQHLLQRLAEYPAQREGIADVSRRFAALLEPARRSFEAQFGPFPQPQTLYLVNSLGEMDGGTRELAGRTYLIFGADMIARLHTGHNIQPFFHHELFHLHHAAYFSGCDQIWCGLWSEGLATYVAKTMNPSATDAELLLTVPEPIPAAVEANRTEAVCTVIAGLDSEDGTATRALFSFDRMNERLPPRFGYYVGYLAAAELGRTRSLQELERMPAEQVRPALEAALRSLVGECPPEPPRN
jgi:hypothetical protein